MASQIAAEIEALAGRVGRTHAEMQAVRAYLLSAAYHKPYEVVRREIGAGPRADVRKMIDRGGILVRKSVGLQRITMAEMREWLGRVRAPGPA